ncbi:MAG: type IV toxin-antitoxin system AbiEi family antitoxin domain-containing protein [Bacteroidales bacterium]|nr:type IV toxin-antitoxin system AbiEi family antitoxin domain-containing protein [Bacteroidales bacterium]
MPTINKKYIFNTAEQQGGFITAREADTRGEYEQLRKAVAEGEMIRVRKGVYALPEALASNMVDVERIVPRGVLCLYSAFLHYDLSTQVPAALCVAIEAKRKVQIPEYPLIDLYYWKKEYLQLGVVKQNITGHSVLITDVERTVCDAVKYRNKIGLDVCGEVINNYLKRENRNISLLNEYAQKLRVKRILSMYLETRL